MQSIGASATLSSAARIVDGPTMGALPAGSNDALTGIADRAISLRIALRRLEPDGRRVEIVKSAALSDAGRRSITRSMDSQP